MFLDEIIRHKREEVQARRAQADLRRRQDLLIEAPAVRPFAAALRRSDGRIGLIAEIKKASPSAGVIQPNFDPVRLAHEYASAGADCVSVLTDEKYFQGHLDYLTDARNSVKLPCLRKDFIVDEFQIVEARIAGADAILLIVAALTPTEIQEFAAAGKALGMDVLVEVHSEAELDTALEAGSNLIGINSRNLKTFEVDLAVIERVAKLVPHSVTLVGESGIKTREDVERLLAAGVHAILVGETLMRAENIAGAVSDLVG